MTDIETQREERNARHAATYLTGEARRRYEELRSEGYSAYTAMEQLEYESDPMNF